MLGAGSAGIGVVEGLFHAMKGEGLSDEDARSHFWLVDNRGLLDSTRTELTAGQKAFAQPAEKTAQWRRSTTGPVGLADVIANIEATALIGLSTAGGAFTEPIVREMARKVDRPIIFPLSNPTTKSEAAAGDLIRWTEGRALVATGSPFSPVSFGGRTISIAQCNNVFIFPAMGLGVIAARATRITESMMLAAAKALAANSPAMKDPQGSLLPRLADIRAVAVEIAVAVGREAQKLNLSPVVSEEELRRRVIATQWTPSYEPFTETTS